MLLGVGALEARAAPEGETQEAAASDAEAPSEPDGADSVDLADSLDTGGLEIDLSNAAADFNDDLLLFRDLPMVVTATRRAQQIHKLSAPVSVLTAKDIHYSGANTIPDLMQFVPGMDVLAVDRNRYAVGVRGLHDPSSDRTLTLINGRNAGSPVFGGTDFLKLPLFLEDIERIEIVRGPGGAAWGANAFNGVINIITKRPEDVQGVFLSSAVTHFGDVHTHLRWGASDGDWSWRTSFGYDRRVSSEDAIGGSDFESQDHSEGFRFDGEAVNHLSDQSQLTFGLAHARIRHGDSEFLDFFAGKTGRTDSTRAFARLDHEFAGGSKGYLQWFGNYLAQDNPSLQKTFAIENDLEAQLNFDAGSSHELSVGANVRWSHVESEITRPESIVFRNEPLDEFWAGVFVIDQWKVSKRWTIESQLRLDWYSETELDWSGRLTSLHALDEDEQHILRFSVAKAFRAPLPSFREGELQFGLLPSPPFPPDTFAFDLRRAGSLDHEQIYSFEAGYTGLLADGVTLSTNAYYQRYEDLIGVRIIEFNDPISVFEFDNLDGADAYGAEAEIAFTGNAGRLSLWYAFNNFESDKSQQDVRAFLPARHKVGATGRLHLPADWTMNANYRFTGSTPNNPSLGGSIRSHHRLDLAAAKRFAGGRAEAMIGVADVFNDTQLSVFGLGDFTSHPSPGRTFFVRLQINF